MQYNDRFLRYSLEHKRSIRMMLQLPNGSLKTYTVMVEEYNDTSVTLYVLRPVQRLTLPRDAILAIDYVKGDDGLY